jgi:hypothetical protein
VKASYSIGGTRDYIILSAETVAECAELVQVAQAPFCAKDAVHLSGSFALPHTVELRIWMSDDRSIVPHGEAKGEEP